MKLAATFALTVALGASHLLAGSMVFQGDDAASAESVVASYSGKFDYVSGSGILSVYLENTSPADNGGYLTGFVFDLNAVDVSASLLWGSNANFVDTGVESASPFGTFENGAAVGGAWLGGGRPQDGIGVGDSGSFTFQLIGDMGAINEDALVSSLLVRFRGFNDGSSDKVPAVFGGSIGGGGGDNSTPIAIPLPPAVLTGLSTLGLIATVAFGRKLPKLLAA